MTDATNILNVSGKKKSGAELIIKKLQSVNSEDVKTRPWWKTLTVLTEQ